MACETPALCAKLAASIAVRPTSEPDERSMPAMMMVCVTPTAMMPITASCRIMIFRRSGLARKLWPTKIQPSASNSSMMPIMTPRMLSSGGRRRRAARWGSLGAAGLEAGCDGHVFASRR